MALPNKRIKKIKLPTSNDAYEIIPERLQGNGKEASLPQLNEDRVITTEYSKSFGYTISSIPANTELYFGQVTAKDLKLGWELEYLITITGSLDITPTSGAYIHYKNSRVCISSSGGTSDGSGTTIANDFAFLFVTNEQASHKITGSSGGGFSFLSTEIIRGINAPYYSSAIQNGFGNLVGIKDLYYRNFETNNTLSFNIVILREYNCKFQFFDNIINGYTNTPIYQWSSASVGNIREYTPDQPGFNSPLIDLARDQVSVQSNMSSNVNYYLTGAWGNAYKNKSSLYGDYQLYYNINSGLHSPSFVTPGNTIYRSTGIDVGNVTLSFPNTSGRLALTTDISNIEIDDLTNINN